MSDLGRYRALLPILACPDCHAALAEHEGGVRCAGCQRSFPSAAGNVLSLMPSHAKPEPAIYDDPDFKKFRALYDANTEALYYSKQNALFEWIHNSAHHTTHRYWAEGAANGRVADIGCGTGDHFSLFPNLSNVIGLDMSLGSLSVVRKRFPDALLIQADVNALPIRDGAFAAVFSIYNLEHLFYLAEALSEIDRVMSRDGRFFVGLPAEGGLAWALGRKLSMDRTYSKKYGINYARAMQVEHCNTAPEVMRQCQRVFAMRRRHYFPLSILPNVNLNLTISAEFAKRKPAGPR